MKYKSWTLEDAFTLIQALELRLSSIGFHVAIVNGSRVKKFGEMRVRIYGNKIMVQDRANINSLLRATEMRLLGIGKSGEEEWSYGRGKNMKLVEIVFD